MIFINILSQIDLVLEMVCLEEFSLSKKISKELMEIYLKTSCLYFYLKSRIFFSKKEARFPFKPSDSSLDFNSSGRKKFIIFTHFSDKSFLAFFLKKLEKLLFCFWGTVSFSTLFCSQENKNLEQATQGLSRELSELVLQNDFGLDGKIQKVIDSYYRVYLGELNYYLKLLAVRSRLIIRFQKQDSKKQSSFGFLVNYDASILRYQNRLECFAHSLVMQKLAYFKEPYPNYIKNFKIDYLNRVDKLVGPYF